MGKSLVSCFFLRHSVYTHEVCINFLTELCFCFLGEIWSIIFRAHHPVSARDAKMNSIIGVNILLNISWMALQTIFNINIIADLQRLTLNLCFSVDLNLGSYTYTRYTQWHRKMEQVLCVKICYICRHEESWTQKWMKILPIGADFSLFLWVQVPSLPLAPLSCPFSVAKRPLLTALSRTSVGVQLPHPLVSKWACDSDSFYSCSAWNVSLHYANWLDSLEKTSKYRSAPEWGNASYDCAIIFRYWKTMKAVCDNYC